MDTINIKDVPLDIRQQKLISIGDFYQNDTNIIKFTLSDNNNPADLSNVDEILINYKRPDGEIISRLLEAESNIINYQLGQSEMQIAGLGKLVLQFFSNDKRLSTFVINVSVKKSIETNFEFEEGENPLADQLFEKMNTFNDRLDNLVIEGGGVPSNVIIFEDWIPGETVTIGDTPTPPIDTTAPILTITQGGNFTSTKSITMSVNESAVIYYTLNGSNPTVNSSVYTSAITISGTTTLKAFARDTAGNSSAIQTIVYTLVVPEPGDTTPPNNVTNLQVSNNTTGTSLTLTWTSSTSSDVSGYEVYRGTTLLSTVTSNSYNVTGLTANTSYTFVVKAKDASNNVASGTSVTATAILVDATPPILTITPATTFTNTQTVTMSTNETATIYYTLDGNTPTQTSPIYSTPLTLNATTTLKAFAKDTAGNLSAVQTVAYTKVEAGEPQVLFYDSFNRADNPNGVSISDSGHEWKTNVATNGTTIYGIRDNGYYLVGGTDTRNSPSKRMTYHTLNTNSFTLETTVPERAGTGNHAIGIRITPNSSTNYIHLLVTHINANIKYALSKLVSGQNVVTVATSTISTERGNRIKIKNHSSGLIEVFINDNLEISVTDEFLLSPTITIGLGMDNTDGLFEDIKITEL